MPRKNTKTEETKPETTANKKAQKDVAEDVEAEAPPKKAGRKRAPKTEEATTATTAETSSETKTRQTPTRDSVEKEFDELVASIDEEIGRLRDAPSKSKGVKFLRSVNKRVKALKNHALRISKQKTTVRRNNTNSGFLKPVQISKDLAKFTGWEHNQPRSRVDVTKFICNYIKEKNLQDPEDKRNIRVDSDPALKKLLKYDNTEGKPLTYYSLQTYLKSHFTPSPQAENAHKPKPKAK
jgi:upstream activation factor subunit UAF30